MGNKKLSLEELTVTSFVTNMDVEKRGKLHGGDDRTEPGDTNFAHCTETPTISTNLYEHCLHTPCFEF